MCHSDTLLYREIEREATASKKLSLWAALSSWSFATSRTTWKKQKEDPYIHIEFLLPKLSQLLPLALP